MEQKTTHDFISEYLGKPIEQCIDDHVSVPVCNLLMQMYAAQDGVIVSTAVHRLTAAIVADEDYRRTWQANIAVAFQDEFEKSVPEGGYNRNFIHKVSNRAANNFLQALCNASFEVLV